MKFAAKALLVFAALNAVTAHSQDPTNPQGKITNVIVIIQENRTVDNLFGSNPAFELGGLNIENYGYGYVSGPGR